jgi:hypothetical protein
MEVLMPILHGDAEGGRVVVMRMLRQRTYDQFFVGGDSKNAVDVI